MELIVSAQNQYVKRYRSLEKKKVRESAGLIPLEGARLVGDAIRSGAVPEAILLKEGLQPEDIPYLQPRADMPVVFVEKKLFDRTAFTDSPQGILAVVKKPQYSLDDVFAGASPLVVAADGIQDPGNLGTMLRSAAAAGAAGAVLLPGTVDAANPKALRSAMGANFLLPIAECSRETFIAELQRRGVCLVSAGSDGTIAYDGCDWKMPTAVVVGNEGAGISPEMKAAADVTVSIPMAAGVESLNAAVAASVILFEAARQRRQD